MNLGLLARYLLGSRAAILQLASSPRAIVPAFLFVLSAGFAREYDGEDILHAPWHFLRPAGASLVTATILFVIVHGLCWLRSNSGKGTVPSTKQAYLRFLTVFWWTAPLAWLYAFPFERLLGSVEAMEANLWVLGLVAAWRVILTTRVVQVLYGIGVVHATVLVLLFADLVVIFVLMVVPLPVLDLMGGIRYSEQDMLLAEVTSNLGFLALIGSPVLILGSLFSLLRARPNWMEPVEEIPMAGPRRLAIVSLVVWIPVLPFTQSEQRTRTRAEELLEGGEVAEALRFLSEHEVGDLPPHWDPPPRMGFEPLVPDMDQITAALLAEPPADWVAQLFLAKLEMWILNELTGDIRPVWELAFEIHGEWDEDPAYRPKLADLPRIQYELAQLELVASRAVERTDEEREAMEGLLALRRAQVERLGGSKR